MTGPPPPVHGLVDHLFRHHCGQMIATLTRIFGIEHLDAVEDAVQDALVQALKQWPFRGQPDNPTAWLTQVAKNRMLDRLRRVGSWQRRQEQVERAFAARRLDPDAEPAFSRELRDDQLEMIFICCHPELSREAQVALTLKIVGGFSSAEIARAFLTREATVAQRIVRAKRKLREAGVDLELPEPAGLPVRLQPVLDVVYLMFNEGHAVSEGDSLIRADLCFEAIRLAELLADHPEAGAPPIHALAALLLFQASRLGTRQNPRGELLLLADQDRESWDRALIARGLGRLRLSARGDEVTSYHLEAEIASLHALAPSAAATDWPRILRCYDDLLALRPAPVVALNRAIALAQVAGDDAGLAALEPLAAEPALAAYLPYWSARGELLRRSGRTEEARAAFAHALELAGSAPLRRFLMRRLNG